MFDNIYIKSITHTHTHTHTHTYIYIYILNLNKFNSKRWNREKNINKKTYKKSNKNNGDKIW